MCCVSGRDVTYDKSSNQSSASHLFHDLYVSIEFNQVQDRHIILAFHAVNYTGGCSDINHYIIPLLLSGTSLGFTQQENSDSNHLKLKIHILQ